jgi:hypothetical protein
MVVVTTVKIYDYDNHVIISVKTLNFGGRLWCGAFHEIHGVAWARSEESCGRVMLEMTPDGISLFPREAVAKGRWVFCSFPL